MLVQIFFLLSGLTMILVAAEFFTNAIEAFGRHFSFTQAVVGSIFAAVGTALPETILPIVAIFFYHGQSAKDMGVGAILGAPFMLSTLAFFLVGLTVTLATLNKKRKFELKIEVKAITRDLSFFLVMYSLGVLLPFFLGKVFLVPIAVALVMGYMVYAWMTLRGESARMEHSEEMYLWGLIKRTKPMSFTESAPLSIILIQVAAALAAMIKGAHIFVGGLEHISLRFGMNPLLFTLLLAPFATELPEKFNSITWIWKGRDTLAVGNITGAMVFQATFPVLVGLLFTDWNINGMALFSAVLAMISALTVLSMMLIRKRLSPLTMLFPGALYFFYMAVIVLRR
jgi:cation:H+ antiporter